MFVLVRYFFFKNQSTICVIVPKSNLPNVQEWIMFGSEENSKSDKWLKMRQTSTHLLHALLDVILQSTEKK